MKKIVLLGAGRSAQWFIAHLRSLAASGIANVKVGDLGLAPLTDNNYTQLPIDASDTEAVRQLLTNADFAISLLPPAMHLSIAALCVELGVHFASASYETDAIRALDADARAKGISIISECGLDPGLDHITAHAAIDALHQQGAKITAFRSFCGGLPAKNNLNDWGYRFFWNPMNVVLAGADGARYLDSGKQILKPYSDVFDTLWDVATADAENLVAYPNRDSIPYIHKYGLPDATQFVRGTIRYKEFATRWHGLVACGITNNAILLEPETTYGEWLALSTSRGNAGMQALMEMVGSLGWQTKTIGSRKTSAQILLDVLLIGWQGGGATQDRILLRHEIDYVGVDGSNASKTITLDLEGNEHFSAMAMTVGKPLAMVLDLYINGIAYTGCTIPSDPALWPFLSALLPKFNLELNLD